jgi:TrwC relaxase
MSIHKLTAGAGYDYLIGQIAALDATEKGHIGLASYYTERGETPGVWIGSGLDGIDGLTAGDPVTAGQMRALFGCGLHPLVELRQQQLEGPDLTPRDYQDAARLGTPFKIVDGDVSPFRLEVARRFAAINTAAGLPADAPLPASDRARVRTDVAREFFLAEHCREPVDAPRTGRTDRERLQAANTDSRGLRHDVLPGEVSFDLMGGRRTGGGGCDRTGPSGRRQGRADIHRGACPVHPDRAARDPAGQCPRPGRCRVHTPRQSGGRPGSAHPRRGANKVQRRSGRSGRSSASTAA